MNEKAQLIAKDFAEKMAGHLPDDKIKAAVDKIKTTTTSYPATGSVVLGKLYVIITDGKRFDGKIGSAGGGAFGGDVYTDDIERLYRDTVGFQITAGVAYASVVFFDSNSNYLGNFQGAGTGGFAGGFAGGGSGGWSAQ
jgi:hypothetical protein